MVMGAGAFANRWEHGSAAYYRAALTVNANSSWDAIYRAGLKPLWPQVHIRNTYVPVANFCVDGDTLRGGRGAQCLERTTNGENSDCTREVGFDLNTSRAYTQEIVTYVTNGENSERVVVGYANGLHALSYDIPVAIVGNDGENRGEEIVAFTKRFDIPACRVDEQQQQQQQQRQQRQQQQRRR